MKDQHKTKRQLIEELGVLRNQLDELKDAETKRKQAEEALRIASLYTRSLIEASLDPFVTIGADGKIMDVNKATELVTGVPREQLIGSDFSSFFTEPWKAREGYEEVFSKGTVTDYPLAIRHTTGRTTEVLYNATVYRNDAGEVQGVFAAARDISQLKKSQDALRTASFYVRSLIEASLDPLVTIRPDGKIMDVNEATERITGLARNRLIGSDFSEYFTEPDKAREGYQRVMSEGFVRDYPLSIRHISGSTTDVLYNATIYRNEASKIQGVFAAARDITERKRAEKALQESEKKYREVVENATEIIYAVDEKGNFTYANPAGLKVTGYSLEELRGFSYMDLVLPEHRERVMETYVNQFREKISTTHIEFPFFNKAGEIIWFSQNATLVIEGERVVGFHIIARDITERKRVEEFLRESEARYRDLIETARDVIFTLSPQGVFT
ncbi:MAG TPA: PAS domain S-box protein, partial [Thermodesulfobacteriota bacterium]|nr:PAS domain S-box protein [Thermodesulfobacteriota bacterium]